MKKVLIISYYWPPSGGSGVQRWLKMSKYLPEFGWKPIIYTPENPEANSTDESLLKDVSQDTVVIKRRIREPYRLYKFLSGKKRDSKIKANAIGESSNSGISIKGILKKFTIWIRGNFFIPDPRISWVAPSVKFLENWCRENHIDAIISTGPPHSMHLIAKELHKSTHIPWIADFRDPWTRIFWFKHLNLTQRSYRKHRELELSVLADCNALVVVSNQMKADYLEDLTAINCSDTDKIAVITNGYDPSDFDENTNSELKDYSKELEEKYSNKFLIAHTGLLTDSANPSLFWQALKEYTESNKDFCKVLKIALLGQTDSQAKEDIHKWGLDRFCEDYGYSAHNLCTAFQKRANLLLLPLRKEKESGAILTGKFFEYLASGSPIIAFGPEESDLGNILRETNSGTICEYSDIKKIKVCLAKSFEDYKSGVQKRDDSNREIFSRKHLSNKYSELLNSITTK